MTSFAHGIVGATAQDSGGIVNGLDAVAVSDGMEQTFGDPAAQPYPVATGDIAHTEATLSAGPTGYALASTAWPGPLAGNAGSLALLLGPKEVPDEAGNANYKGRAEAFSGGPNDASLPGMTAHAAGGEAEALAEAQNFENSQGQTTGEVRTRSYSSYATGVLHSVSTCTASDMSFAAGAVKIGSVHTEAEAVTNGASSSSGGSTVVSGMTVGGQHADVDENGVRFTDDATAPIGEQILSHFGITMFVAAPRHSEGPSSASHHAGSLTVIWDPPGTGYGYIYNICGSSAAVDLRNGLAFVLGEDPTTSLPPLPPIVDEPGFTAPFDTLPFTPGTGASAASPARPPTPTTFASSPIGFVSHLSNWPYLIGALCVVAAGFGLRRARDAALVPRTATVACPLEGAHA